MEKYIYRGKLERVVDGDTIDALIDVGFDIWIKKRIRYKGIDTWESRTRDLEEKKKGLVAKARTKQLLEEVSNKRGYFRLKSHGVGKYGRVLGELSYDEAKPGSDVWLTIDLRYQYIVENALRKVGRGAAVVVAPRTYQRGNDGEQDTVYAGDILAMASVPSYDPNKFIPSISEEDWNAYLNNDNDPLINRALKDHAPGSTFKIPVALSGMLSGIENKS